jgi:5-carboxymethyl-2-hydroxymuconic-semialdehyde dehydrogenase
MSLQANIAKATCYLARFKTEGVRHRIAGQDFGSDSSFETISPVDLTTLASVARGGAHEIDQAAKAAFPGWAGLTGKARREILHAVADGIVARAE